MTLNFRSSCFHTPSPPVLGLQACMPNLFYMVLSFQSSVSHMLSSQLSPTPAHGYSYLLLEAKARQETQGQSLTLRTLIWASREWNLPFLLSCDFGFKQRHKCMFFSRQCHTFMINSMRLMLAYPVCGFAADRKTGRAWGPALFTLASSLFPAS